VERCTWAIYPLSIGPSNATVVRSKRWVLKQFRAPLRRWTYPNINATEKEKKNEILAKDADTTQKHITAVKHWSPPSFYCSALPDLRLVLFPEMSVSQPFPKGFGDE